MTFEQFTTNVRQWATERGIYEHSTAVAQALKACSEAGELCDAVIKGDREAMIDAAGDVVTCVVNVAHMTGAELHMLSSPEKMPSINWAAAQVILWSARVADELCCNTYAQYEIDELIYALEDFCGVVGLDFLECCESAWNEIKDRKGRMVAGGAFIKE